MDISNKFDEEPRTFIKTETKTDGPELYAEKDLGVSIYFNSDNHYGCCL
jgi:hypothetical protein